MFFDSLALAGSPVQWAVAALIAVVIFAPRLLPPIARMVAHVLKLEARRRLGLPDQAPPDRRPPVEVLPPEPPCPTAPPTDARPYTPPAPSPSSHSLLWTGLLVAGAIAVLLWYLLHTR